MNRRSAMQTLTGFSMATPVLTAQVGALPGFNASKLSPAVVAILTESVNGYLTGKNRAPGKLHEIQALTRVVLAHFDETGFTKYVESTVTNEASRVLSNPTPADVAKYIASAKAFGLSLTEADVRKTLAMSFSQRLAMLDKLKSSGLQQIQATAVTAIAASANKPGRVGALNMSPSFMSTEPEIEVYDLPTSPPPPTDTDQNNQITFVANTMTLLGTMWGGGAFLMGGAAACPVCAAGGIALAAVGQLIRLLNTSGGGGGGSDGPRPEVPPHE